MRKNQLAFLVFLVFDVSHKALIEAELEQQKREIISKLEKGQVLEGTVKNITSYGVFIDLGGVSLTWIRPSTPGATSRNAP